MSSLIDALGRERLVKDRVAAAQVAVPGEPPPVSLLRLCEAGLLQGGLTVAFNVRPDELVGPLTLAMGGAARRFKLVDVRERPHLELHALVGERTERWEVEDLPALVHNLNDVYRDDAGVRAVAVLGEWADALQLVCVDKRALPRLLRQSFFEPLNRAALLAMTGEGERE
ncbi:hypothetical protein [Stigmatella aurantiaca]|uniref:Conserved uncharacterized protein n=1 Tax=Stigmatella aurantiaca (strain DW4/3-1) TaxID=378806 RepID=Q099K0_STIAD|nr:hypothetical protein [Stigmatella aurantiaca]ADO75813.1 conserved uncharacterized protein [Stigmatella aurantiaca DW4/3-1]EAU68453.1 hypothetical protein STIAU_3348 [Stigmatella aurantiaca DW4/3-1]